MLPVRLITLLALASLAAAQSGPLTVTSPDKNLEITFAVTAGGQLTCAVDFQGKPVITRSKLGLALKGNPVLGGEVRIVSSSTDGIDEIYRVVAGKSNPVHNHCNALRIELKDLDHYAGMYPKTTDRKSVV